MKKGILILILLILVLFSVSGIYAADADDSLAVSGDAGQMDLSKSNEMESIDSNLEAIEEQEKSTQTDNGTYYALFDKINNVAEGSAVKLENDYRYDGSEDLMAVSIFKSNIVIDGQGHTIDGQRTARIFFVQAENVTIKNITFANAYALDSGSAIYWDFHGMGCVSDCIFENNTAGYDGGAIYWNYGGDGCVSDCMFINNAAGYDGGAICWNYGGDGCVSDCMFINNAAGYNGGAINSYRSYGGCVFGCTFVNNVADINGGAINWESDGGYISLCSFMNNTAGANGGAICSMKDVIADSCVYNTTSDTAFNTTYLAPILSFGNSTPIYPSCRKLMFNLTTSRGAPISDADVTIEVYKNNTLFGTYHCLSGDGWVVDLPLGSFDTIYKTGYPGFDPVNRTITVITDGTTFLDLNKTINGNEDAVINLDKNYAFNSFTDLDFINGIIINRQVIINGNGYTIDAKGKARIFNVSCDNVTINNVSFVNGRASGGGAIFWNGNNGTVLESIFINNTSTEDGGAIHMWKCNYANITGCCFTGNDARGSGGALWWGGKNGDISRSCFISNGAGDAGAICCAVNATTITCCNFTGNNARNNGGGGAIILWLVDGAVSNCNFIGNNAREGSGGAIRLYGANGDISKSCFINNRANDGGAISGEGKGGTVSDCSFTGNNARYNGGSICWFATDGTIYDCSFIANKAQGSGGAVYGYENGDIFNSIFINNVAGDGAAVCGEKELKTDYCWFGNNATNYRGALPIAWNVTCDYILFLNATANPNVVPAFSTSEIVFKLYLYNKTSGNISEYDNDLLLPVNLTITPSNGDVDDDAVNLGDSIRYIATGVGVGSLTATLEAAQFTIVLDNVRANPNLSVENQLVSYCENAIIALDYNSNATGKANITLTGKKGTFTYPNLDLNSTIVLPNVLPVDEYNVTVTYSGDKNFFNATARATLTVKPIIDLSVNISSNKEVYFLGDICVWTITVHNAANGTNATKVELAGLLSTKFIYVSSITYNGTYDNEEGIWEIGLMGNGTDATLIIFAYANAVYANILNEVVVVGDEEEWNYVNNWGYNYVDIIGLPNINKTVSNDNPNYNEEILFYLTITNNATVNYTSMLGVVDSLPIGLEFVRTESITGADLWLPENVNGQNVTWYLTNITNDVPAVITVRVKVTGCGDLANNVEIYSIFGHNKIVGRTVNVPKIKTQLTANAITTTYNINKNLVITLRDSEGNPISGVSVYVNLNGAKTYLTDKNGQVKFNVGKLVPKTYSAKIAFAGNDKYIGSSYDVKVTVNKAKAKMVAKKKTFKKAKKVKKYTITLKSGKTAIKKVWVTLKIKGKRVIKAKTNTKGKATFKIKNLKKKGTFKVTIRFKGNKYYKAVTKKAKIKIR